MQTRIKQSIFILFAVFVIACVNKDQPIATINGISISLPYFKDRYSQFLILTQLNDNLKNRHLFLKSIIDEELILSKAQLDNELNKRIEPELKKGFNQILLNQLYDIKLKSRLSPSESQIRNLYRHSKIHLHVRHLFAQDFETISKIQLELEKGIPWDSLAKIYFKDPILANNGGDLGLVKLGDLDPAFEHVAFSLQDGEISHPVQTDFGYSIIQVIDREHNPFLTEEEYASQKGWLLELAKSNNKKPVVKSFTDSIEKRLDLQYNEKTIALLWEQLPRLLFTQESQLKNGEMVCLTYGQKPHFVTLRDISQELFLLSFEQKKRIKSFDNLRSTIRGILVRNELISLAKEFSLHQSPETWEAYNRFKRNYLIRYSINTYFEMNISNANKNHPVERNEAYLLLIDTLQKDADISIDSLKVLEFTFDSIPMAQSNGVHS